MKGPNVLARVTFRRTEEGGLSEPTPPDTLRCISDFDGERFSCFVLLSEVGSVRPGDVVTVPIQFLYPEYVKPLLHIGRRFDLRDWRPIASVEVVEVYTDAGEVDETKQS